MRMFRFSSWISESKGNEEGVHGSNNNNAMADAVPTDPPSITSPLAEKRGRETDGVVDPVQVKRARVDDGVCSTMSTGGRSSHRIRDAIDAQIGLEILLKHDELRLINQEIAACQTALEQLRRCHLIPYPGSQGLSTDVTAGTGHAVARQGLEPRWAPPFGVADGPYTRHYAKWLIPDPSFDGIQPEGRYDTAAGRSAPEGRATRHSFAESVTPVGKPRAYRGSSQKFQALPSGYAQTKEAAGPSVLKRGDGQMVKLVCLDCQRENFGSTQGFINHCRIAHRREFKSHEEAAVQSGQPIDVGEGGGILGEEKVVPVAPGLVHPLIRTAPTDKAAYAALLSRISDSLHMFHEGKLPDVKCIPSGVIRTPHRSTPSKPSKDFIPSADTPHLSNLLRNRGFSNDLNTLVEQAKKTIDDTADDSSHTDESDDEQLRGHGQRVPTSLDVGTTPQSTPSSRLARGLTFPTVFDRPNSSKGFESRGARMPSFSPRPAQAVPVIDTQAANRDHTSRLAAMPHQQESTDASDEDLIILDARSVELSPNTVSSNNAPSLVSDDGEYDENDDGTESSIESEAGGDTGSDVAEIAFEDLDNAVRGRKGAQNEAIRLKKEGKDRHVTFVSPVKETRQGTGKN